LILTATSAAFLMGLAGSPHCAAMCGPLCAGVLRVARSGDDARPGWWQFQAGRILGYGLAGAAAAQAVESFAWLTSQSTVLRPLWTLLHVAVLVWGMTLLALGRQPLLVGSAGRRLWNRLRPLLPRAGGAFTVGALWTFMPCGLLYSALLAAALSGGPLAGALSMAAFALGGALALAVAPQLLDRLQSKGNPLRQDWGTRAAGGLIVAAAAWALWTDMAERVAIWCGVA
jgi:sulfite exporter TauE/SafE